MAKRKGHCWMCGRAGRLTLEHAFPDWVRKIFAKDGHDITLSDHRAGMTQGSLAWTNTSGEVTVRSVCGDCNTGWMCDLEGRCKPLLEPLILGHHMPLAPDDQAAVGLWAVQTAWVLQSRNPTTSTSTAERRRALATDRSVPDGVQVLLGGYDESGDTVMCNSWYSAGSTTGDQGRPDAAATTLIIGRAVLQVHERPAAGWAPQHSRVGLVRVLPPLDSAIRWPPLPPLREPDLDDFVNPADFTERPWDTLPPLSGSVPPGSFGSADEQG